MEESGARGRLSRLAFGASPRERVGAVWRSTGVLAFYLGLELVLGAPALAQAIRPDGRTATTVTTVGSVTSVTTATVANSNAFNSFQAFSVGAGTTANLYVPSGAANLINIVRDQRTDIYGVLNAIKDGRIGGNVWFANPNGFVVGASGIVNVGSLSVSTPTQAFVDNFFVAPGMPNAAAVTQLLNGTAPRSPAGVIAVDGRVNAADGVALSAGAISVGGAIYSGARFVSSMPDFTDVVNANGVAAANNVVVKEGRIMIVADGDVTVSGTLAAPGGAGVRGGDIGIQAGGNVEVASGAVISARGNGANSAGGTVNVYGSTAAFRSGALIDASAGSSGDGGSIDFSAADKVTLAGGTFAAGAQNGLLGSVIVDPNNIEIVSSNQIVSGANYTLAANNSITVNSGITISTRNIGAGTNYDTDASAGISGDISLAAPSITLNSGSKLLAQADNGFQGGAVTLTATQASGGAAQISLTGATVKGKSVSLQASSSLSSTLSSVTDALVLSGINSSDATASIVVDSSQLASSGGALTLGSVASVNVSATSASIPLAILRVNSNASVDVKGSSSLTTTAGDAHLTALSTVTTNATPSSAFANMAGDGMVAVSGVVSNATVHVGDPVATTAVNIGGLLDLSAANTVTTTQIANAAAAGGSAAGASVAVSTIQATTSATIDGNTTVGAGSLNLSALTANTVTATAKSAAQGAQQDSSGTSKSSQTLAAYKDDTNTGDSGSSGGGVKVAGAVAVSDLQNSTQTSLGSTQLATVNGAVTLTSRATNSAAVSADGSATSGSTGVGVAVAVNVAKSSNQAFVGQNLNAQSLALTAGMNPAGATNQFTTTAVSGAGASSVGVAGSIAVNALDLSSAATINGGFTVTIASGGTGDVLLSSENLSSSSASSTPAAGGASGSKVGIGAAVAVNVVSNRSTAEIQDTAQLNGADDLTVKASGADAVTTTAEAGSSGGTAITPVAAINVVNNTTTARIGVSATTLALTGDLLVQADQTASASASAKGSTQGSSAAIGAAVAVALVDDEVTATTARWIDTTAATVPGKGNVSFLAHGSSASSTSATASVVGGKSDDQASSDDGDVDTKVGKQLGAGTNIKSKNGVGDAAEQSKDGGAAAGKPSASSSEGKVSVAAAVAVNLQTSSATATVPDGGKVNAAGALKLSSSNNTDGSAVSDGSAVGSTTTLGVGAGISINLVKSANEASIGQNATVTANGLTLEALMTPLGGGGSDVTNTLDAEATSGAGGSKVGLAGSLALNIADTSSQALIKSGANVNASGGNASLTAEDRTETTGKALPAGGGASGGKVGIGASVAVNVVANRSLAQLQDTAQLTGAHDLTLQATGEFTMTTQTEAGSAGGVSITPSVAISLANNTTSATLGTSTTGLTLSGDLVVQAEQTSSTTTTAQGSSQGAKAAIGAAVAVALVDDEVTATTARAITANGSVGTGNVSFLAHGASASSASATASAVGGKTDDDAGTTDPATGKPKEDASVDDKVGKQADFGKKQQTDNNVGDASQKASTADSDTSKPSASSSEGKISVAAAVAVNLQKSNATATVPNGGNVSAAGLLTLSSSNNTDGSALTDGSAVGSTTTVGIGAGVSVNLVKSANEASIGTGATVSAHGVTIEALMTSVGGDLTNTLDAEAKSGAGGSKVGLAGSLALNIADTTSYALVKSGATVNANGGDVSLTAADTTSTTGKALPADAGGASGGKVGIGASVAVNVVANRSTAEIQDTAQLTGSRDLTVHATGAFDMLTQTEAGSQGGISITPSVAISLADNSTTARIGASATALTLTGDLLVQADQTSTTSTIAKGSSQGAKAAIGAAVAVALVDDEVSATTSRAVIANGAAGAGKGNVSFLAHGASASSASATASAVGGKTDDDAGTTDPATGKPKEDASVDDKVKKQSDFGKDTQASNNVGDSKQQASTAGTADNNKASASSSEGKISVAAAVSVNLQTSSATATVPDGGSITAAGALKLSASNNTDGTALTDGSAVGSTTTLGIGAGVSVNLVKSVNEASIGQNATVTAKGVTLEALMTDVKGDGSDLTNTLDAEAKSGAGGTKVGLAGSLALNIIDTSSQALVKSGAAVNALSGDVSLTAVDNTSTTGKALPADAGGASGGKVGIGASVTVNIVANRSIAEIQDGAQLTNPGNVNLGATGIYAVDSEAEAGAAGGVAITPVLALGLINNTTSARIGSGSALVNPGAVTLTADHTSTTTTSAKGSTQGDKAAVGAAVGIVLLNDVASATADRDIQGAGGNVTLSAHASSSSTNNAIASAVGGKSTDDAGTTDPATGKPSEDSTVDSKVDNQVGYGKTTQTNNNVGDAKQQSSTSSAANNKPSAKSDEGQVAVAAAVAVNIVSASATATVGNVSTSGALKLSATGNTDGTATSDGSVVGKTQKVGIGAAVSVNKVDSHNEASIGTGATVSAHGVTIEALTTNVAGDTTNTLDAEASSGAGGSKVGVAASLALNLANTSGAALVKSGATVNANGGDVSLTSQDYSSYTAKAVPTTTGGASGGSVGVGASVALNLITSSSQAQIGTNAGVTSAGNLTLTATTKGDSDAEATAGASGGKLAFDAAVAVTTLGQTTDASIESGSDISATGNVGLTSTSSGKHTATTTGVAKSGSVAIGASVGVITSTSATTATIDRNVSAGGSFGLAASSTRSYDAGATATAGGSQSDSTYSDSNNQTQKSGAASTQALSKQNSSTNQGTQGGGKVDVAAAVSVIVIDDDVKAQVTGGRTIQAGAASAAQITATNLTNFSARGEGNAVDPQTKVGVGIGVGIVIANNDTTAALADNTHLTQAGSVSVLATSKENTDPNFSSKLSAEGIAGAGGNKVGVAGAFAVVDSNTTTSATLGASTTIANTTGAVVIDAENTSMLAAKAWAGALGGNVGVGASVATVISDNDYTAQIGAGSDVTAGSLSITARNNKVLPGPSSLSSISVSSIDDVKNIPAQLTGGGTLLGGGNYYTEAIAGAAGGSAAVAGSFAVSVFNDTTDASIGGATIKATSGTVSLLASNDTVARSLAGGASLGGSVGVGVSSADVASTNTTKAHIDGGAQITQSAGISLSALNKQDIQTIGFAAAGAGSVGVGGVANVITLNNTVEAYVGNSPSTLLSSNGSLSLSATNTVTGLNIASGLAVGGSAGVGVAGAVNTLGTDSNNQFATHAYIGSGATANVATATTLTANATEDMTTFAIGGAAGGSAGVGGAAVVNVMNTDTQAYIGAGAKVNKAQTLTNQTVSLAATDNTDMFNVVGAAGVGGSAGVGASADVGVLSKNTQAYVGNGAWVETAGNLMVQAASSEDLRSIALGFGAGGSAGVAGSVSVYSLTTTTKGYLDDNSTLRAKGSALISADDTTSLDLIAGSAAGGGAAAVGAGVGVAVFSKTTQAYVGDNADVVALGNGAGVTAATGDFNISAGSTITGDGQVSDSSVSAKDTQGNTIGGRSAFNYLTKQRVSTAATTSVNGLAVAATNRDKVESFAVTGAAAGAAAVTIGGSIAVVTTDTEASIGSGTQVNQASIAGSSASGAQSVRVAAGNDQFHLGLAGAASGAGAAAIGAGADVLVANNTTLATIGANAQVKAARDVEVLARGQEQYLEMGAGLSAAGAVAIAGSVGVISLTDETYATIEGGTTRVDAGGNARVASSDNTETNMIAGAAAAGFGTAGFGVAVGVNTITKDTQATVGNGTTINALGGSGAGTLTAFTGDDTDSTVAMHGVQVQATSKEDLFDVTASGAGGLFAGISGAVTVTVVNSGTTASIGDSAQINTTNGGAASDQDVNVAARNQLNSLAYTGSLAIGAVGLGGGADILTAKNNTSATVGTGAEVHAVRDVAVNALSKDQLSSLVVSAAGGLVGIAGGVSVYSIGDKLSSDSQSQLNTSSGDIKDQSDSASSDGTIGSLLSSSTDANAKSISASAQAKRSAVTTKSALSSGAPAPGNSASIGANAKIFAGDDVSVNSRGSLTFNSTTGAAAVGALGAGAGIGIANFSLNNQASIGAGAEITATDDVSVRAQLDETASGIGFAGAAGIVSANAALSMFSDNSVTKASIGSGAKVHHADALTVSATDNRAVDSQALGASVGALAVGASVSTSSVGGTTSAFIDSGAQIGAGSDVVNSLSVTANSNAKATSSSMAAAGGIGLAASGSVATATVNPTVSAYLNGGNVDLTGNAQVQATGAAGASADAEGFNISLAVSAGASVASATSAPQISAYLGSGTNLTASNLTVAAIQALPSSLTVFDATLNRSTVSGVSALANANGASAALFAGINATSSEAQDDSLVQSYVGDSSTLDVANIATVSASNTTSQRANASGIAGGIVAAGANIASAHSSSLTDAHLGNGVTLGHASNFANELHVTATGNESNLAVSTSGSGGLVSGAAATAATSTTSQTNASTGSGDITHKLSAASIEVHAAHTTQFNGTVDSVNASLVGASGATATHNVNSTVTAAIGDSAVVDTNALTLKAENTSYKFWLGAGNAAQDATLGADNAGWNINSGSGGLINLPAGSSTSHLRHVTTATIGDQASVHVLTPAIGTGYFAADAYNAYILHDKAKLDAGGAIAIAQANSIISVDQSDASVVFGTGAKVTMDSGDLNAGARANVNIDVRSSANAYGLAGAPSGDGYANYTGNNRVVVNDGAKLQADDGGINLSGGEDSSGVPTSIIANASVNTWNKTAFPIDTDPDAQVNISNNAGVSILGTSQVLAAGDIGLYADKGSVNATAKGIGKDFYREAASAIASGVSNLFGGGDVSFDITTGTTNVGGLAQVGVDGTVLTGIHRTESLTLDLQLVDGAGNPVSSPVSSPVYQTDPLGNFVLDGSGNKIVTGHTVLWLLKPTATKGVTYSVQTGVSLSADIQARINKLRSLMAQYVGDSVAVGAYQSEINFLQIKLVELGLASQSGTDAATGQPIVNPGQWNNPSPRATAQLQITQYQGQVSSAVSTIDTAGSTVNTNTSNASTSLGTIATKVGTIDSSASTLSTNNGSIQTQLLALANASATNATYKSTYTDPGNLVSTASSLVSQIDSAKALNATDKTTIDSKNADITTALNAITGTGGLKSQIDTLIQSNSSTAASQIATLQAQIDSNQATIATRTTEIGGLLSTISTRSTSISTLSSQLVTTYSSIATNQAALVTAFRGGTGDDTKVTTLNTTIGNNVTPRGNVSSASSSIGTQAGLFTGSSGYSQVVSGQDTAIQTALNSKSGAQTQINTLTAALPTLSTTAANGPIADVVTVNDVSVRLGNIRTKGDLLTGSGVISAPGDAQITITNNTPDFLKVNNLTVLSDDGGTVRFNGVLVNSNSDINAINAPVPGQSANFATVLTRDSQGASVPKPAITITSNYDPLGAGTAVLAPAPNIELLKDLTNLRGSVTVHSAAGSILSDGSIHAGTVDVKANNGDFVQSFVDNFFHVGGDPASIHDDGTALGPGIVANGSVFISARYLNINSLVQSGIEQWNITLPTLSSMQLTGSAAFYGIAQSTLDTDKAAYLNALAVNPATANPIFNHTRSDGLVVTYDAAQDRIEVNKNFADSDTTTANWATRTSANSGLYKLVSDYGNIGASYDPVNQRFLLDGTQVRGGLIQLYGQIMNTSTNGAGKLRVLDGYGQIQVNNPTQLPVVLNVLDTGSDPTGTGRGVAGVIDITDVQGIGTNGTTPTTTHTVYTRLGGVVMKNGVADAAASDGRDSAYNPQSDLRYVWTTGTDNSTVTYWEYSGAQFFGSSDLRTGPTGNVVSQSGPFVLNSYRLDSGTYLSKGATLGGAHASANTAGNNYAQTSTTNTSGSPLWVKTGEWSDCNWWTLCIAQDYHMTFTETTPTKTITTKSLKADNSIGIQFSGYDSGTVTVNSASSVLLNGAIRNRAGDTTINAGSGVTPYAGVSTADAGIVQMNDSALISSKNLTLNATGSVGAALGASPAKAVAVDVAGGVFNAGAANGNVLVNQTLGALNVGSVIATGDALSSLGRVNIQSDGSILAAGPGSLIQGQLVELNSENGGIGSIASPLKVNVGYTDTVAQRGFYGLKASARDDIGIATSAWSGNTAGNLLVNTVVSSGGDVLLSAPGRVIDNNPTEQIDTRTWNELVNFWDSIGLRAGSAENLANQQKAVKSYELGIDQDYKLYWQIRNRQADPSVYDSSFQFHVTATERAALTAQGMSSTDIANFEANRTTQYQQLNTELSAKSALGLNLTSSFDPSFQYNTAQLAASGHTDPQVALILNKSSWTDRELGISITPGLLKDITNTNPVVKSANVQGRNVTINAGVAIGETQSSVVVPTNVDPSCSTGPGCLTDDMKVALAAAERSDLDLSNPNQITVVLRKPVNFDASTALNVNVANTVSANPDNGMAFLASLGDGRLGAISVPGETRIKVRGSIINENGSSPAVQTGDLVLEAANGGIGYIPDTGLGATSAPLRINLNPNATLTARAADNVDIVATGDMNVDTVYSRKDAKLTASGSIKDAFSDSELNVLGDTIQLGATTGSIGTSTNLLDVGVNPTGSITASAAQGAYLNGPLGRSFVINSVTAGDAVKLTADVDMKIDGPVTAPGTIGLVAGGTMALTPNANVHATLLSTSLAAGAVTMDAGSKVGVDIGDLDVQSNSTLTMADGAAMTVNQGTINIATVGDAVVTGIFTGNPTASAINITSTAGHILAGHTLGSGHLDIVADTAPGAKLTMSAALGIGAEPLNVQLLNLQANSGGVVDVTVQNNPATPVSTVSVTAADRVLLTSNVSISGGTVASTGAGTNPDQTVTVTSTTGNVDLSSVSGQSTVAVTGQTGVTVNTANAGQGATFNAPAGAVNVTTGTAGADVTLTASGNAGGGTLTSTGGNISASSSGGNVNVGTANANQGASFTATTGSVTVNSGTAGGNVTLVGTAGATGTTLTSTGGSVNASSSGGNVSVGTANAGQGATFTATTGSVDVNSATAGGNVALAGATGVTGTTLTSTGGSVNASSSGGNVDLGTTSAGQNVSFSAPTGTATANTTTAGGAIIGSSGQDMTIGSATSGGSTLLNTGGALDATSLTSTGGSVIASATGDINVTTGSASGGFTLASATGNVDAGTLTANSVSLSAPGSVTGGTLNVSSSVNLAADLVTANVNGGGQVAGGSVTGFNGGVASNVNLTLSSPSGFALTNFSTATGSVDVPAGTLSIADALVVDRATFNNPITSLLVDQNSRTIQGSGVQLYTGGAGFSLFMNSNHVDTNAFVIYRNPNYEVITPFSTNSSANEARYDATSRIDAGRPPEERQPFDDLGEVLSYSGPTVSLEGACSPDLDPGCAK